MRRSRQQRREARRVRLLAALKDLDALRHLLQELLDEEGAP
jgi:hypothetical protein